MAKTVVSALTSREDVPSTDAEIISRSALRSFDGSDDVARQFCELYNEHRTRLFAYIFSLTADRTMAEDILQEASLVMWREFDQFELGSSFLAWARQVAFNRVRESRRRRQRESMVFSDDVVRQLADDRVKLDSHLEERWDQFQQCVSKLREKDAELIDLYYANESTAEEVCRQTGRGIHAVRKAIKRIRRTLFECVGRNLPGRAS